MTCPICAKQTERKYRPFCSRRCADLDLAKWLGGGYALPGERPEDRAEALAEIERQTGGDGPAADPKAH